MGLAQKMAAAQAQCAQAAQGGGVYGPPPPQQYQAYHPSQLYYGFQQDRDGLADKQPTYPLPESTDTPLCKMGLAQKMAAAEAQGAQAEQASGIYGPPPVSSYQDIGQYVRQLEEAIEQKRLQSFCPPAESRVRVTAQNAAQKVDKLVAAWQIPREIAVDIVR